MRWLGPILLALTVPALAQQVDIKSYGARCNGSDDAAAVQATINAVPNGGTVLVSCMAGIGPAGLQLDNRSGVTILGAGGGAGFTSLAPTGNSITGISWSSLLKIASSTNCAVRNIVFEMNYQPVAAIGLNYNTGVIVDSNQIYNVGNGVPNSGDHAGPSAAIEAALNTSNQYTNNLIQHTIGWYGGPANGQSDGPRGMWIGNTGATETQPLIANNVITDTFHTGLATHTDNATVSGNSVSNAGTGPAYSKAGGACIKETNVASVQTVIANNDFSFCAQGVQVENAGNITIQNNSIHGVLGSGVYESGPTVNLTITGNTFTDNANGIAIQGATNWTIAGNSFVDDPSQTPQVGNAIEISATWVGQPVSAIAVANNNIAGNQYGGVHILDQGGTVNGVSIANNSIYNSLSAGIWIQQAAAGAIANVSESGDCFSGNAGGAIQDNRGLLRSPPQSSSCPAAPSIALTSPVAGASYAAPATVLLEASANGNGAAITLVEYYSGANKIGQATASPYSFTWSNVGPGNYTITARATSAVGQAATSAAVPLTVVERLRPPLRRRPGMRIVRTSPDPQ
jgi:parallel beta-helix repeat protein